VELQAGTNIQRLVPWMTAHDAIMLCSSLPLPTRNSTQQG